MRRLMVQGDRDATHIEDAVRELGQLCKERGIGLNVGESGEIVRLMVVTGAHVRVHQAKREQPNVHERVSTSIVDCIAPAESAIDNLRGQTTVGLGSGITEQRLAWAIRLACLNASEGFIFFHGREGTLAHLIPILAFIKKGEVDKGVARPRRVVLLDWPMGSARPIFELMGIPSDSNWLREFFGDDATKKAVDWLTEGLPA